ncbi:cellulase family glycosylhydrolase, partial [bacterium]|nr:cellulase family glycosylhydrolase [bacterium]
MNTPIRIHPQNPKLFEFRGQPRVLVTATEHYGAVMNRPFRFDRYLADAGAKGITLTRLFLLFRELQSAVNPYSTCKPESPDYIAPFPRTGPGVALDGQPRYDLDRWNPEFFDRLHRFLSLASDHGINVELVLFSNSYSDAVWALNPFHASNNVNGLQEIPFPDYLSRRHDDLFVRQCAHARQMVEETNRYDHVFYEICNEPGGDHPTIADAPSAAEVNDWQRAIAAVIRQTEQGLPHRHLVAGQEAFRWHGPFEQSTTRSFRDLPIEIVNVHPLPDTTFAGASYDLGQFMSKQLKLRAVRDYCLATYPEPKPLNLDEDNVASQYKDVDGWTIHRKRAWTTLFSGGHYDYIDFSIINYCETGTPESQRHIRAWIGHLARFIHALDLVRARPLPGLLQHQPAQTLESVFGVAGEDYCVYLADDRELGAPGAGDPIAGDLVLDLPPSSFHVACFAPVTGLWSPAVTLTGGANTRIHLPEFRHDLTVRIQA